MKSPPQPTPANPDLYSLAYVEGQRLIDDQASVLESLRSRMQSSMAFFSGATGVLIGAVLGIRDDVLQAPVAMIIGASVATVFAVLSSILVVADVSIFFWRGRNKWVFRFDPKIILCWIPANPDANLARFYEELANRHSRHAEANEKRLDRVRMLQLSALTAWIVQLVAWCLIVSLY